MARVEISLGDYRRESKIYDIGDNPDVNTTEIGKLEIVLEDSTKDSKVW
jgi:hypothetical protein